MDNKEFLKVFFFFKSAKDKLLSKVTYIFFFFLKGHIFLDSNSGRHLPPWKPLQDISLKVKVVKRLTVALVGLTFSKS